MKRHLDRTDKWLTFGRWVWLITLGSLGVGVLLLRPRDSLSSTPPHVLANGSAIQSVSSDRQACIEELVRPRVGNEFTDDPVSTVSTCLSQDCDPPRVRCSTRKIEDIRVGQRVLATNPEVTDTERANWDEPNWTGWIKLKLVMPKPDGARLLIEMLRPEAWVTSQMQFVVDDIPLNYVESLEHDLDEEPRDSAFIPLHPIYQHLHSKLARIASLDLRLLGLTVEMDLPELGLTGEAILVDMRPLLSVDAGLGSVVTATFHHSSGDVIDLVVASDAKHPSGSETIGATSNHPFWSADREEFVQAGMLEPGERVLTYSGDTKRVTSKLARPGPEPVYNLEVHGEHVCFVGENGILVHNNRVYTVTDTIHNQIVYVGKGTKGRVDTALQRVSEATGIPESQLKVRSQVVGDEFVMRGIEQRGILTTLENQGGTLTKRGDPFVRGQGNLVNHQRSYDPMRLNTDQRTNRYKRARRFENNRRDDDLWSGVAEGLGF